MKTISVLKELLAKRAPVAATIKSLWPAASELRDRLEKIKERGLPKLTEREMAPLRSREQAQGELDKIDTALCVATAAEVHAWNRRIVRLRDLRHEAFIGSILPCLGGAENERTVRRDWEYMRVQLGGEMNRAFLEVPPGFGPRLTAENAGDLINRVDRERLVELIPHIVAHERAWCEKLGWPAPETLEEPAPIPERKPPALPAVIRARVKESCRMDELAMHLKRKNKKRRGEWGEPEWEQFYKGEEIDVPGHLWAALGRFFEPVDIKGAAGAGAVNPPANR